MIRRWLVCVALACSATSHGVEIGDDVHTGVATCASSVCHGKLAPQRDENVWLNEFRIWSTEDRHSRAYKTLLTDESKRMAANLGLKNAHTAKICLDCHADNVSSEKRGRKFQITDGVGCEACHGGAERWIETHTEPGVTYAQNVAQGMFPMADPSERARICLNCHLGSRDQFTTHRIMGAGHPRLSFELESFTANQPAHYEVDDDYVARKSSLVEFSLWLSGQVDAATRYLDLLQSNLLSSAGIAPEFSLYDCHSCHHSMQDQRWGGIRKRQGLEPGGLRLQDYHLLMLRAVAGAVSEQDAGEMDRRIAALLRAGQKSYADIRTSASGFAAWLTDRKASWLERDFSSDQVKRIRRLIAQLGADGRMSDYSAAEQAFTSIESLSYFIDDVDAIESTLDKLFETVETEGGYSPARFRSACKSALARL